MKPAAFDYLRPRTVEEAVEQLAQYDGDAKILAGGQSLVPLLNFRMLRPGVLIDINQLRELDHVIEEEGALRIGAMTRHYTLETSLAVRRRFPVLAEAMTHVAHLAIRNRGTIGGSLSHADPAAELPLIAVLLDAQIQTSRASYAAGNFFLGPLTTMLADDELMTAIMFPGLPPRTGWGFEEFALRHGDFAIAAVAATLTMADGGITAARLAVGGAGETPLRLGPVEDGLVGQRFTADRLAAAAEQARELVEPMSDLRASADYRRHLVAVLTERALTAAWNRAA